MRYLIGEIGVSILIAGLIGLFFGWLLSRFLRSRTMAESRQVMLSDIQRRDQEIDRLRYELRGYQDRGYRGESRVAEGSMAGRRDDSRQQNRDSAGAATQEGYKVRTLKTRGTTAVLRVRPDEEKFAPSGEKSSRSKPATARSTARATADERTQDRGTGKSADNRQHAEKKPVDEKEFVTRGQLDTLARGDSGTLSIKDCLLYTSPSPRDLSTSRMPSSA